MKFVHRLVYEQFVGQIPKGMELHHKDFNKMNPRLSNLILVSHKENVKETIKLKRHAYGKRHGFSKLSEKDVIQIKKLPNFKRGDLIKIADKFHISPQSIRNIRRGITWRHIQ